MIVTLYNNEDTTLFLVVNSFKCVVTEVFFQLFLLDIDISQGSTFEVWWDGVITIFF